MIVGFVGLIGSGKNTAASFLVDNCGFRRDSFAASVKDSLSSIFGWDRELLEGITEESRNWRNTVDAWWSERLGIENLTPRLMMQHYATNICRHHLHNDLWVASLENRLRQTTDNVVITDVRFANEIAAIHAAGGIVVRVKRGPDPEWFDAAESVNRGSTGNMSWSTSKRHLQSLGIHESEMAWIGGDIDFTITNNSTVNDLHSQIDHLVKSLESSHPFSKAA
jgi:hypothetical protein